MKIYINCMRIELRTVAEFVKHLQSLAVNFNEWRMEVRDDSLWLVRAPHMPLSTEEHLAWNPNSKIIGISFWCGNMPDRVGHFLNQIRVNLPSCCFEVAFMEIADGEMSVKVASEGDTKRPDSS